MACPMPVSGPHFHDVREFAVMARPTARDVHCPCHFSTFPAVQDICATESM